MELTTLLYAVDGGVATVTLNRPDQRNALDLQMCDDLLTTMRTIRAAPELRVVVIRAAGPAFCAGADLREREGKDAGWVRERRRRAFAAYDAIAECEIPCLAAVHGAVIGSG